MIKIYSLFFIPILLFSCTNKTIKIKNLKKGDLISTHDLIITEEKKFYLDSETAPGPPYIQLISDSLNEPILTFLNPYNSSIYFYDYVDTTFIKRIKYYKEGANAILKLGGYYIHNTDSIYIYNMPLTELVLSNNLGIVNNRISLRSSDPEWPLYMPQYSLSTINPIIKYKQNLILTGQSFFSIPQENISKFKFSACININTNQLNFYHTYPEEIYGFNSNWEGGLPTQVYPTLTSNNMFMYSFPASHDLYLTEYNSEKYEKVYGGSNNAGTIKSIDREAKKTPDELVVSQYLQQDMYAAILYDNFRNVYYRFLLKGIPNASLNTPKEQKPVIIIIMDKNFDYLGETNIGTGEEWNWRNSFVTTEGLNIEYIGNQLNEDFLTFKTFSITSLNQ